MESDAAINSVVATTRLGGSRTRFRRENPSETCPQKSTPHQPQTGRIEDDDDNYEDEKRSSRSVTFKSAW